MSQSVSIAIGETSIRQLDGLFSLNDLHKASGGEEKHKPVWFLRREETKELVTEIEKVEKTHLFLKTIKGRHGGTYVCRELVYAYANWISPAFYLRMIRAFDAMLARPVNPALPHLITSDQAGELSAIIAERFPDGRHRPYAWSRFNNHFRIARYRELPASRFDEACAYIQAMPRPGEAIEDQSFTVNHFHALLDKNGYFIGKKDEWMRRDDLLKLIAS